MNRMIVHRFSNVPACSVC